VLVLRSKESGRENTYMIHATCYMLHDTCCMIYAHQNPVCMHTSTEREREKGRKGGRERYRAQFRARRARVRACEREREKKRRGGRQRAQSLPPFLPFSLSLSLSLSRARARTHTHHTHKRGPRTQSGTTRETAPRATTTKKKTVPDREV